MTKREGLVENYEDALFALVMDELAEDEGRRLSEENERLKGEPDGNIPASTNKKCLRTIKRAFARKRYKEIRGLFPPIFKNVAIFVFVLAIMYGTAYATIAEVRIKTLNFLIEVSDVSTKLILTGDADSINDIRAGKKILLGYKIPDLPDDFVIEDEGSTRKSSWVQYVNKNNETGIYFSVTLGTGTVRNVDSEGAVNEEKVYIHGFEGLLIEKDDRIDIIWGDVERNALVSVFSNGISKELAIKYAEAIEFDG